MTPSRFCSAEALQRRAEAGPQQLQLGVRRSVQRSFTACLLQHAFSRELGTVQKCTVVTNPHALLRPVMRDSSRRFSRSGFSLTWLDG